MEHPAERIWRAVKRRDEVLGNLEWFVHPVSSPGKGPDTFNVIGQRNPRVVYSAPEQELAEALCARLNEVVQPLRAEEDLRARRDIAAALAEWPTA